LGSKCVTIQINFLMRQAIFQRLSLITGGAALEKLNATSVSVFGLGGVGSWCAEALARSGVGKLTLVDSDTVCITNINRQVQATTKTIGEFKAEVLKQRLLEINPECAVRAINKVFSAQTMGGFGESGSGAGNAPGRTAGSEGFGEAGYEPGNKSGKEDEFKIQDADYVIDAIDSLTNKLDLIEAALALNKKLFSCMGMAQKLDPSQIKIANIWETQGCPLAKLVRAGLRKRKITQSFPVVYSKERRELNKGVPVSCGSAACLCSRKNPDAKEWCSSKKVINGSAVTVTATAGMFLASLVVNNVVG